MTGFFDWMAANVEPYVSFQWLVAGLFCAMGVQALLAVALNLRDLARGAGSLSPREQQMARLLKRYGALLLLKTLSFETLRRQRWLIAQIIALAMLAGWLNGWVFTLDR